MKVLLVIILIMFNACGLMKRQPEQKVNYEIYDGISEQDRTELQNLLDKEI